MFKHLINRILVDNFVSVDHEHPQYKTGLKYFEHVKQFNQILKKLQSKSQTHSFCMPLYICLFGQHEWLYCLVRFSTANICMEWFTGDYIHMSWLFLII